MFPDRKYSPKMRHNQQGFLMPLAIFIVVIMGIFVATLARTTAQSSFATSQEGISIQAFYAAESGAQLGMNSLFYNTTTALNPGLVNTSCNTLNLTPTFNIAGLNNCSAAVSCAASTPAPGKGSYIITSIGQCGSGSISATRTIQVSAKME